MMAPYTSEPLEAFMAAQTSVGLTLGALLWFRRLAPRVSTVLFGTGIALAVVAPVSGEFLTGVGVRVEPEHTPNSFSRSRRAAPRWPRCSRAESGFPSRRSWAKARSG